MEEAGAAKQVALQQWTACKEDVAELEVALADSETKMKADSAELGRVRELVRRCRCPGSCAQCSRSTLAALQQP
jgi:hypothetical protein